jgi:AcrR family transcriptional regulator
LSAAREDLLDRVVAWYAAHGVGDTSLRTLAAELGTSHRMLIYHFGSRGGLLSAVVERVERGEREALERLVAGADDPFDAGLAFWQQVADRAETFAPLFFELAGHAMQRQEHAEGLRDWLADGWHQPLTDLYVAAGHPPETAAELARVALAAARGLLFELAVTGDRRAVDAAMARFTAVLRTGG